MYCTGECTHYCERAQRRGMCTCVCNSISLRALRNNAYLELRRTLRYGDIAIQKNWAIETTR